MMWPARDLYLYIVRVHMRPLSKNTEREPLEIPVNMANNTNKRRVQSNPVAHTHRTLCSRNIWRLQLSALQRGFFT